MNTNRFGCFSVLLLISGMTTISNGAEPRQDSRSVRTRPLPRVTQVSHQQTPPTEPQPTLPAISTPDETSPAEPRMWKLHELEALADTIHPLLQRNRARIESARGDALQAGLYPNPRFDTNNPEVFHGQNSVLNAGIMQEFVVKGKKRLDRAAATKVTQQNEFAYIQDRFMLMTALRQQYYAVLAAERRFKVLQKLQEITASSLSTGKLLEKPAGEVAHIDVLVLQIDNQRVQADLENAVRMLEGARNQLGTIVGDPAIHKDRLEGSIYQSPPQYDEKVLDHFVASNSAYIQIAKLDVERNEILLKRALAEPYPNVTVGPTYQWGVTNGNDQFWFTVTFPIPAWDRNQGGILAANANVAASRRQVEAVQLEQLRRVAETFSRHRAVRAQAAKYRDEIIPNTMTTLSFARKGFAAGEYDFTRFLQVQRTVVEANMAYIDLLEDVWKSAAELSGLLQLDNFE